MRERKEILLDLIAYNSNLDSLAQELSQYPWDSAVELVSMSAKDLLPILSKYQHGKISSRELEDWANRIEGREDVGYESENIMEAILRIANPVLHGILSKSHIDSIQRELM